MDKDGRPGGTVVRTSNEDSGKVERGEGGAIIKKIVPDDIVDTRRDQYEGDLHEDESEDDDSTSTSVM
jgi:hypothetical protein